ncbi:MAG: hypothetical protein IJS31_01950 [Oscillospiraceae bacterium]|nr:hypothetical protein [Oscillospiraceae bacterium]
MKKNTATKKLVAMLLAVVLLLGLAGCSLTNKLASPEQYFENVEKKDVADFCDTLTVYYETTSAISLQTTTSTTSRCSLRSTTASRTASGSPSADSLT